MDIFFLEIAGLLQSNNLEKKFFKQHTYYLAIAA